MGVLVSSVFVLLVHGVLEVVDSQDCQSNVTFTTGPGHYLKRHLLDIKERNFLLWQMKGCNIAKMKMIREENAPWRIIHDGVGNASSRVTVDGQTLVSTTKVYLRCDVFVKLWLKWNGDDWSLGLGTVVGVNVIFSWTHTNLTFFNIRISAELTQEVVWTFKNDGVIGKQATMLLIALNKMHASPQNILSTLPADSAGDCATSCFTRMSCSSFSFFRSANVCVLLNFIPDLSELVDYPGANMYSLSLEGRIPYQV